jgi:hypothetical protein
MVPFSLEPRLAPFNKVGHEMPLKERLRKRHGGAPPSLLEHTFKTMSTNVVF